MEKTVLQTKPKPVVTKTAIKAIAKYLIERITSLGFDIYISFSKVSKSRYLEIMLSKNKKIIVRISDHPADSTRRPLYTFDIYTDVWRPGAVDYRVFLKTFRRIMRNSGNKQKRTKFVLVYEYGEKLTAIKNQKSA